MPIVARAIAKPQQIQMTKKLLTIELWLSAGVPVLRLMLAPRTITDAPANATAVQRNPFIVSGRPSVFAVAPATFDCSNDRAQVPGP